MEGAGTDLHVVGLQDDAALVGPEACSARSSLKRAFRAHMSGQIVGHEGSRRGRAGETFGRLACCGVGSTAGLDPPPGAPVTSHPRDRAWTPHGRRFARSYAPERSFQGLILALHASGPTRAASSWQPYDMEVGAGTFHPATTLRALGPKRWKRSLRAAVAAAEGRPLWREPERLQHYTNSGDPEAVAAGHPRALSEIARRHRRRLPAARHPLRRGRLESPTLGAWGLGWECWCDGMEVSQFTYFQQVAGSAVRRSQASSPMAWNGWRCTCRASTASTT